MIVLNHADLILDETYLVSTETRGYVRVSLSAKRNKTKYFRLCLYYEVSKRAYRDLRLTSHSPEADPRQIYKRTMRIQCFRQVCAGKTL